MIEQRELRILLVEDSEGDVVLTRQALREGKIKSQLGVARDGIEAMAYLRMEGRYADALRPDLILLDINMPRMSGIEVLAELKTDASLKSIPVVMLTTSGSDLDILKAYELNANCYVTKPVDFMQFMKVISAIDEFWLSIVKLPSLALRV
jgi:two-component system, chemotaxis family, response regulator Rcp1